jgi:hypothetical protein
MFSRSSLTILARLVLVRCRVGLTMGAAICEVLPKPLRIGPLAMLTRPRLRQYSMGYDLSGVLDHPLLSRVPMTSYRVGLSRMLDEYLAHLTGFDSWLHL